MRRLRVVPLVCTLLLFAAGTLRCQGKITSDPNTPEARKLAAQEITSRFDQRLSKKVTYTSGLRRLHEAADDLSRTSGVTISGNTDKFPTDPALLAGMTMRLKQERRWTDPKGRMVFTNPPESTKGLREIQDYVLYFEWTDKGQKMHTNSGHMPSMLPMYSKKRFAELFPNLVEKADKPAQAAPPRQ